MTELYLKAADEAAMNAILLAAGLIVEQPVQIQTGEDDDGNPVVEDATVLVPVAGVNLDVIGPITKWDYTVDPPVEIVYPEWHVNVRCEGLDESQLAVPADIKIAAPIIPYRVWA